MLTSATPLKILLCFIHANLFFIFTLIFQKMIILYSLEAGVNRFFSERYSGGRPEGSPLLGGADFGFFRGWRRELPESNSILILTPTLTMPPQAFWQRPRPTLRHHPLPLQIHQSQAEENNHG
ncbi:MAG: hypothetical protein ACOX6W_16425 [Lentisphaeria bacterium]|jgi:hypothetical protein